MPRRRGTCNQFSATGTCSWGAKCKFSHAPSPSDSGTPLDVFFEGHDGFVYNPSNPAWDEFHRLARHERWDKYKKADERASFKDALVQAFNAIYGTDENDLASWMTLCHALSITPPEGLEACRAAVKATFVNLVDLVDLPNSEDTLQLFDTEEELSVYTLENHKIFPKESAYAGGLLRHLLRQIMNPEKGATTSIRRFRKRRH
ncbi:hypothetical protein DXG01_015587 [Tephrocybe rancida]|nr:hypothetical protein DXG01_015587 [Tephrocybe rancida]